MAEIGSDYGIRGVKYEKYKELECRQVGNFNK